ncbi:hypothetical protein [[Scytonema hofmanni] UTEX B 1581]|uniref:hypothetical protein n=1 Tax=[Scytonema hofmanni] UTEX B 1581 TaxID=379535 RepID=UPI001641E5D6|nr:hypothetical protein [[Scytonema hofmanni] UTEX B 1581]
MSRTILKMNKSGNKQENPLQKQTEEISKEIAESTADSQLIQPLNSIGVRKIGVATVTKRPPKTPPPRRK